MGLKARFDDHPVGSGLALIILGITIATGTVLPVEKRRNDNAKQRIELAYREKEFAYKNRQQQLETVVNSIERRVGNEKDFLPVEKFFIRPTEASQLPEAIESFPDDRFYALKPDRDAGWDLVRTTELASLAEVGGMSPAEVEKTFEIKQELLTAIPIYLWRHKDVKTVSGFEGIVKLPTQIIVQRVRYDDLGVLADASGLGASKDGSSYLSDLEALYRGDATGQMLSQDLFLSLAAFSDFNRSRVSLSTVEKRGNVVYTRIETTLKDVTIDGVHYDEYYFDRESIYVSGRDDFLVAKTIVPSSDRRSPQTSYINQWFASLRIVAQ